MTTHDVEKRALQISLIVGIGKALLFFLVPLVVVKIDSAFVFFRALFLVISLGVFIEFFFYYRPNMIYHKDLAKRVGRPYQDELEKALTDIGLFRMLQQNWFVKKYKEKWGI